MNSAGPAVRAVRAADPLEVMEMARAVQSRRVWRTAGVLAGAAVLATWAALAMAAPLLSPYGDDEQRPDETLQPPSARHLFGTDDLGRDILTRVLYGGRVTLLIGIGVVAVASGAGMAVGTVSGYVGGGPDELIMRST